MSDGVDLISDIEDGALDGEFVDNGGAGVAAPVHGTQKTPNGTVPLDKVEHVREPKETSLRDSLTAAFTGKDGEPAAQADGRVRGPDGRFIEKPAVDPNAVADPNAASAAQPIAPPNWFPPAQAEQFKQLPAELQTFFASTMEGLSQQAERYRSYDQLEQIISPRREAGALDGMTEHQAVNHLFALSDFASNKPAEFIAWFADQQGIDLEALLDGDGEGEPLNPVIATLQNQVHELTEQLNGFSNGQATQQHAQTVNSVIAYASEKDGEGNLLRPYFEELGKTVLPYIEQAKREMPQASSNDILNAAYDRACWATPAIREKMLAATEAKKLVELRARTGRARDASSSVTGAPESGVSAQDNASRTLREEIAHNMAASRG